MTLRLRAFAAIPPSLLRPFVVRSLLRHTAEAFGTPSPSLRRMPGRDMLRALAEFSDANARSALLSGTRRHLDAARRDLWGSAHRLGRRVRGFLGVRTTADVMVAARALYRMLDIDLRGSAAGDVVVARCSFARVYAPEVCAVMSALDAGVFAGLTGGRRLAFSRRITEGAPACLARLGAPGEVAA
jgi:hypothetical protein